MAKLVLTTPESDKRNKRKRARLDEEVDRTRSRIGRLAKGDGPVLAGPFTGEVGFELLYWIPLLRWAVEEFPGLRGRLTVISRGGVQDWIHGLDARYVDILSLFQPEEFAAHRALRDKQRKEAEFETRVVDRVRRELGTPEAAVLHPALLYEAYFRFLKINQLAYPRSITRDDHGRTVGLTAIYEPIPPPDLGALAAALPDEYVAVRFYSRDSFPATEESQRFAARVIQSLRESTNVVLVGQRQALDEHRDVQGELPPDVVTIDHLLRPENNLAIQTAVVASAQMFVGTYGGFSYLAPFLGVPSLSFSTDPARTQPWHYELAQRIFDDPAWGDFVALRHTDLPIIEKVTRRFPFNGDSAALDDGPALQLHGGVRPT